MRWQSFQRWHLSQKSRILLFSSFDGLLWRPCYHLPEKKTNFKQCRLFCNLQPTNQIGAQLVSIWVRRFLSTDLLLLCFLLSKLFEQIFFRIFFSIFLRTFLRFFYVIKNLIWPICLEKLFLKESIILKCLPPDFYEVLVIKFVGHWVCCFCLFIRHWPCLYSLKSLTNWQ